MAGKRILVVDDDRLIRWALERELTAWDLSTRAVETGAQAISELRSRAYDLVFLDVHLPDADGLELVREVEKLSPEARIIVMSGDASDDNRERALAEGAQFLEKPFELANVRGLVRDAVGPLVRSRRPPS